MPAFRYRCPNTALSVQSWIAHDLSDYDDERYETVICNACRCVHLVNPKTGKIVATRMTNK